MPTIDPNHPRHAHRFGGVELQVPYPFKEGDVLTAPHAKQMNQWLATTVGNGFNRKLSDVVAKHNADPANKKNQIEAAADLPDFDHQSAFDEAFGAYQLGVSNRGSGGSESADPVMRQAMSLARIQVTQLITSRGLKVRDFQTAKTESGESKFTTLVSEYLSKNPWLMESAKAQLAALAEHSAEGDSELDLGIEGSKTPERDAA